MFSLNRHPIKILSVNPRNETHGDELVLCVDLSVEFVLPNTRLNEFHERLQRSMYFKDRSVIAAQKNPDLPGVETDAPNLLCPRLEGPFKLNFEGAGYRCQLSYGVNGALAHVTLAEAEFNNVRINPKEGGTVELKARIQQAKISGEDHGRLAIMLGHQVDCTLTPPEAAEYEPKASTAPAKKKKGEKVFADALDGKSDRPFGDAD